MMRILVLALYCITCAAQARGCNDLDRTELLASWQRAWDRNKLSVQISQIYNVRNFDRTCTAQVMTNMGRGEIGFELTTIDGKEYLRSWLNKLCDNTPCQ